MKGMVVAILLMQLAGQRIQAQTLQAEEEATLHIRAQAQQVEDANEVMDGLEKLSRFPEAARVLLQQVEDPQLLKALRAMHRPKPLAVAPVTSVKPKLPRPVGIQKPAVKRTAEMRVVGAWAAPTPKAIFLGAEGYHIVYVGESFKSGPKTYTLRKITQLPSLEEGGDRRYRVEFGDEKGAMTRLVWPKL